MTRQEQIQHIQEVLGCTEKFAMWYLRFEIARQIGLGVFWGVVTWAIIGTATYAYFTYNIPMVP